MTWEERLGSKVEDELRMLGFELVKLEGSILGKKKVLRLYIDHPERGVTVDDCVHVTKVIGFMLDAESLIEGPYNLEVSSPGINRPLSKPEHFRRFTGKTAKVVLAGAGEPGGSRIGEIIGADEDSVTLSVEGEEQRIPFERISKANLHGEKWEITHGKRAKK